MFVRPSLHLNVGVFIVLSWNIHTVFSLLLSCYESIIVRSVLLRHLADTDFCIEIQLSASLKIKVSA